MHLKRVLHKKATDDRAVWGDKTTTFFAALTYFECQSSSFLCQPRCDQQNVLLIRRQRTQKSWCNQLDASLLSAWWYFSMEQDSRMASEETSKFMLVCAEVSGCEPGACLHTCSRQTNTFCFPFFPTTNFQCGWTWSHPLLYACVASSIVSIGRCVWRAMSCLPSSKIREAKQRPDNDQFVFTRACAWMESAFLCWGLVTRSDRIKYKIWLFLMLKHWAKYFLLSTLCKHTLEMAVVSHFFQTVSLQTLVSCLGYRFVFQASGIFHDMLFTKKTKILFSSACAFCLLVCLSKTGVHMQVFAQFCMKTHKNTVFPFYLSLKFLLARTHVLVKSRVQENTSQHWRHPGSQMFMLRLCVINWHLELGREGEEGGRQAHVSPHDTGVGCQWYPDSRSKCVSKQGYDAATARLESRKLEPSSLGPGTPGTSAGNYGPVTWVTSCDPASRKSASQSPLPAPKKVNKQKLAAAKSADISEAGRLWGGIQEEKRKNLIRWKDCTFWNVFHVQDWIDLQSSSHWQSVEDHEAQADRTQNATHARMYLQHLLLDRMHLQILPNYWTWALIMKEVNFVTESFFNVFPVAGSVPSIPIPHHRWQKRSTASYLSTYLKPTLRKIEWTQGHPPHPAAVFSPSVPRHNTCGFLRSATGIQTLVFESHNWVNLQKCHRDPTLERNPDGDKHNLTR